MWTVTALPYATKELEHVWIPTRDGTRLAARIWLPASAEDEPVPAILEYIPYRKRDLTSVRDSMNYPYLAGHGFGCVRVIFVAPATPKASWSTGIDLWLENWLCNQRRTPYWKHASVCESYDDVCCPVFAVSGWADGYSNAVLRLLRNLNGPRKGLIGPWSHQHPHMGEPGPAIGFLQEVVRWFDCWLREGDQAEIIDEPMLRT